MNESRLRQILWEFFRDMKDNEKDIDDKEFVESLHNDTVTEFAQRIESLYD